MPAEGEKPWWSFMVRLAMVLVSVGLLVIGGVHFLNAMFANGDGGKTLAKLERQASAELPGVDVRFRESTEKPRIIKLEAAANVGSVDEVMSIHRGAVALAATAGDADWKFGSEITVHMARPGDQLGLTFGDRTDPGELKGILEDERAWVFDQIALGERPHPVRFTGPSCRRADMRCFTDRATAAAGIEEAGYRTPISRETITGGHIAIEIPVHDAPLLEREAEVRGDPAFGADLRRNTTVVVEVSGQRDRAAAADAVRWSVPVVGKMTAIGFEDDGRQRPLRVKPDLSTGYDGTVVIELRAENTGTSPDDHDRVADRVEAMLRELVAAGSDAPSAGKGIHVTIREEYGSGPTRVVVGGCSDEPAVSDQEARLRAEFEKC
ncbi:hypothetical protein ACFORJ_03120 [Corynebacterium hansenii]|uniref:Secreted protein n=1 Tax=Corynebacterium hansenii TaxID=394964 RepID=A0ABV7ZLX8_9CORY|nr:hypothetical protein [Corynebacterium hansenii]WJY99008.1 hypothetical protein CHAN_01885 [Corynebacterium hansenii]